MLIVECNLGTDWCAVFYTLLIFSAILLILSALQLYQEHLRSIIFPWSQKLVYITQILETFIMTLHLLFYGDEFNPLFLLQEYFISIQYSTVFYYFTIQLCNAYNSLQVFTNIKTPLVIINFGMLIGFLIIITVYLSLNIGLYNCDNLTYIYLHSCNAILSLLFLFFGVRTGQVLRALYEKKRLLIDMSKFKQFWILIICMTFASIVNIGETIWYIGIGNSTCYDSYVQGTDGNIAIFVAIRFCSHYMVVITCLIVFRFTNSERQSIVLADYPKSELSQSYLDDSNEHNNLRNTGRVNMTTRI